MQDNPFGHIPVAQPQQPAPAPAAIGGRRVISGVAPAERRAQEDQEIQRRRLQMEEERMRKGDEVKAPSGYRYRTDGELEPIPGGPAERGIQGNAIPQGAFEKADAYVGQFATMANALDTFQDEFAGNTITGGLENTAQRYSPIPVGTPGQSQWWSEFKSLDNQIRNDLFGSALTATEKAAYAQTTVEPGMNPATVRNNLKRRVDILQGALGRRREFFIANGYKPEAVDAIFSPLLERQAEPDQESVPPPAFGREDEQGVAPEGPPPEPAPDYRPGAGMDGGDGTVGSEVATGEFRREDDPTLSGVRQEYARRLGEGQTAEQLIKWMRSAGINDPTAFRAAQAQVKFRDENPGVPIEQYDTTQLDDRVVPLSGFERAAGQAINTDVGTYFANAGNALSGFTLDNIVGMTGGNAERARLGIEAASRKNPLPAITGTVTGGVLASLGGEAALGAGLGMRAGMGRALVADAAFGGAAGAGATDDGSSRLVGGAQGAAAGLAGSFVGQKAGQGLSRVARGSQNPQIGALRQAGVTDLTVGQAAGQGGRVGQAVKGVEDRLSGVPIVGDMVNARRSEGMRQFNQAAFRKALEPIGGDVGDKVGQEAVEEAQAQVSKAYTDALSGVGIVPDAAFNGAFSSALMGVQSLKRVGPEVFDDVIDVFKAYDADPMLSGEAVDVISRELRSIKSAYKNDPRFTAISKQIDRVERSVFDLVDRQASGKIPAYMDARRAYRRLSTLEDAVLKAQNQTENVFTPAQLGQADKSNTRRFGGKRAAARGDTPFNELQQAGQAVLPNRVPDSGTAGRLLIPLVALGGGGAADALPGDSGGAGLTIGAIVAGLYSRTGQRLLTKGSRGMTPGTRRNAIMQSPRTQRALGASAAAGSAGLLTNRQ